MTTEKKIKHTQLTFLKLENLDSGSGLRKNLMRILFQALTELNGGEFRESKQSMSVLMKGDFTEPHDEAVRTDNDCVSRIDFAAYYSDAQLDEKGHKLAEMCKEGGYKLGPTLIIRMGNKLGMDTELFYWEWTI